MRTIYSDLQILTSTVFTQRRGAVGAGRTSAVNGESETETVYKTTAEQVRHQRLSDERLDRNSSRHCNGTTVDV